MYDPLATAAHTTVMIRTSTRSRWDQRCRSRLQGQPGHIQHPARRQRFLRENLLATAIGRARATNLKSCISSKERYAWRGLWQRAGMMGVKVRNLEEVVLPRDLFTLVLTQYRFLSHAPIPSNIRPRRVPRCTYMTSFLHLLLHRAWSRLATCVFHDIRTRSGFVVCSLPTAYAHWSSDRVEEELRSGQEKNGECLARTCNRSDSSHPSIGSGFPAI